MECKSFLFPINQTEDSTIDFNANSKSIAIGLVKNESDIICLWLSHLLASFDKVFLVDHMSDDGTFEFLAEVATNYPDRIFLYRFTDPGYYQEEITNLIASLAAQSFPDSWIFPLDADEFIWINGQNDFSEILNNFDIEKSIFFPWVPAIPYAVEVDTELRPFYPLLISSEISPYKKVGLHANLINQGRHKFIQGNHQINQPMDYEQAGNLLHIPIRSLDHLTLKCIQGCLSYEKISFNRPKEGQGFHWFQMLNAAKKNGGFSSDQLRYFAAFYGLEEIKGEGAFTPYQLVEKGWNISSLPVARFSHGVELKRIKDFKDLLNEIKEKLNDPVVRSVVRGIEQGKKESFSSFFNEVIQELDENIIPSCDKDLPHSDCDFLIEFLAPAFVPIKQHVPSSWAEHIPFLFCLIKLLKPKRYVELGTHYGASFFAACQASIETECCTQCIAIDSWKGDKQAGEYDEDVFDFFLNILENNYWEIGFFIRKLFQDANFQFENRSIDLLHIDGFHSYEAVKSDFEQWLPKLDNSGVILFHDTHVFLPDFGVHKLWKEIEQDYPSFCFEHGHGLGLIFVGENRDSLVAKFFDRIKRPNVAKFLKTFFSHMGPYSSIVSPD